MGALHGIQAMKKAGLEFQINTTITKTNHHQLEGIMVSPLGWGPPPTTFSSSSPQAGEKRWQIRPYLPRIMKKL
jgi:hypothetical protein